MTERKARPPIRDQVSAGGVLFRRRGADAEIAVIRPRGSDRWQLPKGIVESGESPESTAVREAWEETGVESELVAPLDTIEYWFQARESGELVRIHNACALLYCSRQRAARSAAGIARSTRRAGSRSPTRWRL